MMLWADLYKSKKMRAVSLWNDFPWFCNVSQVGKEYTSITILKFFGLSFFHNDSSKQLPA